MSYTPTDLSDHDFLHSYIAEYLDGRLPDNLKGRFEGLLTDPDFGELGDRFQKARGQLQMGLQSYYLRENEMLDIRSLVQDPSVKATHEQMAIQDLERKETFGNLWRRLVLIGIVVGFIGYLFYVFAPSETEFKPLDYLGYESLAMEEDATGRLDLPTRDLDEVRDYIESYPGLTFSPKVLQKIDGWDVLGATVIDYEVAKVTVVQYESESLGEYMFHFSFAGSLADLPRSEPGNHDGLIYQAYANDRLNFIAWQHDAEMVSLLVGRRGTADLAMIAVKGGGKP